MLALALALALAFYTFFTLYTLYKLSTKLKPTLTLMPTLSLLSLLLYTINYILSTITLLETWNSMLFFKDRAIKSLALVHGAIGGCNNLFCCRRCKLNIGMVSFNIYPANPFAPNTNGC